VSWYERRRPAQLHFHFLTLFPETIRVWLTTSILGRAHEAGLFTFNLVQFAISRPTATALSTTSPMARRRDGVESGNAGPRRGRAARVGGVIR